MSSLLVSLLDQSTLDHPGPIPNGVKVGIMLEETRLLRTASTS
jgi:hypothetical protein